MPQFKRRLAGFHVAAALATLLCVAAQTAKADNLPNQCSVTFNVFHPDTSGRPGEYVTKLVYTPPPGFQFLAKTFVKPNNAVDYKQQIDASGNLVLTMPAPPNQFPLSSTSPSSFQFSIGIKSTTLSCNYSAQDLQGMLITTSLSDGYITTSRFADDGSGNMAGGTGTPAADMPAVIDPTKFTKLAGALPCSPNTQTSPGQNLSNSCPDPTKVGAADGDPLLEGGQLSQSPAVRSCAPAGALATLLQNPNIGGGSVTAYVPNGSWSTLNTGLQVVPIEPAGGTPVPVPTGEVINSCASNSATGQTVCTANSNSIYFLSGTTLAGPLTSGASGMAQFSNGMCQNCGIAINQTTNTAAITMGLTSGTGLQFLDLGTGYFSLPVGAANPVSEGIVWDSSRKLILSPSEANLYMGNSGIYDLFDTSNVQSPIPAPDNNGPVAVSAPEYKNIVSEGGGQVQLDSAAEDCTTGIALATNEAQRKLYLGDLNQATFTSGSPTGSWTTAQAFPILEEFATAHVPTGIAIAPGSHLAILTGEFGGNQFGVLKLPDTPPAQGTPPSLNDHVAASLPPLPDNSTWSQGLDPHAITAYVSPNDGKAYGLLANAPTVCPTDLTKHVAPTYLAVIDLAAVLAAPRNGNIVSGALDSSVVRYIPTGAPSTCQ
jgi:hypothetical protein